MNSVELDTGKQASAVNDSRGQTIVGYELGYSNLGPSDAIIGRP